MSPAGARSGAPLRFLLMSAISFGLNLGITAGLHEGFGVSPELAFAVGLVTAFVVNFAAMRFWVFPDSGQPIAKQLATFALASLVARSTEYGAFLLLHHLAGVFYLAAAATTLVVSMLAKYFIYGSWLFAERES
jgi:putative flippase GtrA